MRASRFRQQLTAKEPKTRLIETGAWEPGSNNALDTHLKIVIQSTIPKDIEV